MTDIDEFFKRIKSNYPYFMPIFNDLFKDLDGFEEIFREFEHEMNDDLVNMINKIESEDRHRSEAFIYGYSINIDENGKAEINEFGNIKSSSEGEENLEVSESREPLVDIIEGKNAVTVVIELPGVEKSDIKVEIKESIIFVTTINSKNYYKEIPLTGKIIANSARARYNNGILEIIINKDNKSDSENNIVVIE
ncbi:MAG: Hsp20/alpha crystallin family protein [Thaumarchaeota archaeon]|mgnify:FL=1|nr:Hsp20/alpha crystallin family protein [Nitrososphaerota archaeon]NSL77188.1 Hsp20/alpha crystallin family protein [Nitrososphaerota archaeon]